MRKGDNAWRIGEYAEAARHYRRAYTQTPPKERAKRGQLSWKQAESYRRIGHAARARGAYLNALRYAYPDSLLPLHLSEMQRMMNNGKGATRLLEQALPTDSLTPEFRQRLRLQLQNAQETVDFKQEKSKYTVRPMALLHSSRSDYSACFAPPEGHQLVFTSTRKKSMGDDVSGITGMKAGDLFICRLNEKGKWTMPEPLKAINTDDDEGACCFSPNGNTLFFTRCVTDAHYPRMAAIYYSTRSDAQWSKASALKITADTLSSYAHPAVSPDGKYLYFVSDMPGGEGGLDIWRVPLEGNSVAGAVENIGPPINTRGDEMFPTFRYNGDFYFSSNGHYPNYGGLDIYRAPAAMLLNEKEKEDKKTEEAYVQLLQARSQWNTPSAAPKVEHLPYPINSQADDFGLSFDGKKTEGLLSSSRSTGGRGCDKIYRFEYPASLIEMRGWVYEQDGYELPAAEVYVIGSDGTNEKLSVRSNGSFEMALAPGVNYMWLATCKGYMNHQAQLHLDTLRADQLHGKKEYTLQFPLASRQHPVLVRGIFYKFDDAAISDSSQSALNRLAELLTQNPNVSIALGSHTDCRGRDAYNLALSQRRAQSVVDYLIAKGIHRGRLKAVGYGEERPLVVSKRLHEQFSFLAVGDTLTEAYILRLPEAQREIAHALNRRTTFKVLQTGYGLFDEKGRLRLRQEKPPTATAP